MQLNEESMSAEGKQGRGRRCVLGQVLCALDETAREEFPRHLLLAGIDANTHSSIAGGPARSMQQVSRLENHGLIITAISYVAMAAHWRAGTHLNTRRLFFRDNIGILRRFICLR